jgi:antitoxin component YwqK of YwqJK toxin-antitoxin module
MKYILILTVLFTSGAFASAFDDTLALAQQGDPVSQRNLAFLYESGGDIEQDFDKAFSWYSQSAIQGDSVSAWKLGDFYSKGLERAIDANGTVLSIAQEALRSRGTRILDDGRVNLFLTALTVANAVSDRVYCSSENPDYYIDAYKWYKIAILSSPQKEFIDNSTEVALTLLKEPKGRDKTEGFALKYIGLGLTKLILEGQEGSDPNKVIQTNTNNLTKLTSVMSKEQKKKAEELATVCLNSDYQDCLTGDYNAPNNQSHSFQTTLYDKSTKWKVSECTATGGKLESKYLTTDSGYIDQRFSSKGIKLSEIVRLNKDDGHITQSFSKNGNLIAKGVFKDNEWERESFYENGSLKNETFFKNNEGKSKSFNENGILLEEVFGTSIKISDDYQVNLVPTITSSYSKSGRLEYKVDYSENSKAIYSKKGHVKQKVFYVSRPTKKGKKISQEYYSSKGKLVRKLFYTKRNAISYTEYYNADGVLVRAKNADGSRRSIKLQVND